MVTTTIIIGLLTIISNIGITFYNRGKNRKIYEIKSLFTGGGKNEEDINKLLKNGNYTVLYVGEDFHNTRLLRYTLGRVK